VAIGTLGHALLGLLAERECTGYELTRTFDESLAHVWPTKHSQIYPELAKLQAAGLIRQSGAGARGSKTYAATAEGLAEVRRWMRDTMPSESVRTERMLRVFFLWLLPPEEASAYLREIGGRYRERLARYEAIAATIPPDGPEDRMSRIAIEAGIRFESAMADWASWAVEEIAKSAS
jgi:PadR family transcriptional regulator, regulatory protein AphA